MTASYPTDAEKYVLRSAEQLMEKTMSRYDPSHDAYHVQRVRRTALAIANSLDPKPDLLVVELAALLHDVPDKKYVAPELTADPLAFFMPFFTSVQTHVDLISSGRAKLITKIVENVSWTTEKRLRESGAITEWHESCIELHCVQDADRLDAIGAFGVMRCSAFSSATNRPLHVPEEDPRYEESAVAHFHDKLLKIKERLRTGPGKKMGQERHDFMMTFLAALDREYITLA
ncbi:uncharacterized protein FOMMEDRAFT_131733 [Fomitiporia mediterranea MF3/22]|uniref:uncharacterized protein n=1 Tax=Fomitiporia mediterranea (strain MF3/22) TaxID=694068 RepID=UPI0004408563|nr:uncharacterized protein FOMMEDRAFT_131733 [Fomitiporia mediterranea MF3/22]EJD06957.1 hypothetical protein FOMMEDRAFT_131733 [Fomitiporia mediterranea MF3/22]